MSSALGNILERGDIEVVLILQFFKKNVGRKNNVLDGSFSTQVNSFILAASLLWLAHLTSIYPLGDVTVIAPGLLAMLHDSLLWYVAYKSSASSNTFLISRRFLQSVSQTGG